MVGGRPSRFMGNKSIPLSVPCLKGNELNYVTECIQSEWISSVGSYVTRFENDMATYLKVPHAVACMNGTSALHISLILSGVGPEDEVIVPTLTFIASANAVRYVGGHPVFMDCDDHLNIDPEKLNDFFEKECYHSAEGFVNRETKRRVKAIIVVHVFGHPVDIEPIIELAKKYHVKLIEDAAESLGSYYKCAGSQKKMTGTIGDFGCLSFNGNKLITTGGGGMIITHQKDLADRARHLTTQAKEDPFYSRHDQIGYNYRLTNVQAAIGVAQLEQVGRFLEIKRQNFEKYCEALQDIEEVRFISEPDYSRSNYWHYSLVVEPEGQRSRDGLLALFKKNGVESRPLWFPCHRQKPYKNCFAFQIEKADWYWERVLNIPCSVSLKDEEITTLIQLIRNYYGKN